MLSNTNAQRINAPHLPTDGSNVRPISSRSIATMPTLIHPTAVIHPDAQIHPTVQVGAYAVIGGNVTIGAGTVIGAHVVIDGETQIGEQNQLFTGAVIGSPPQDLKYDGGCNAVCIGNGNQIREYVTINQATQTGEVTQIGDNNLLMAYTHVGHNCVLENHVIIANGVALAGHIHIESYARISGVLGVHQFVRIGRLSMVGGMTRIDRDVPPYMLIEGNPARVRTLNLVGLKRSGLISDDVLKSLKKGFRQLYRSGLTLEQALEAISLLPDNEHLAHLQTFVRHSMAGNRGLTPGNKSNRQRTE
ncbi:acyl-ACP--UDP-N-acetylglucosamine O-acyltransferase [Romeriopsis navalis]|nr:acyl-ACP--UDP-N-acetylglucosamine O-acyltransferase [Romeriopsis navalis]